jgi:hypothetical protein
VEMEPITLFARIADPAAVARRLRELAPAVEIDGPDDDWRNAIVTFGVGNQARSLTFTHDPNYYSEPNWSNQMTGMRGFFSRFPGERIDRASGDVFSSCHSASQERHQAANWLREGPETYSEASVAT